MCILHWIMVVRVGYNLCDYKILFRTIGLGSLMCTKSVGQRIKIMYISCL